MQGPSLVRERLAEAVACHQLMLEGDVAERLCAVGAVIVAAYRNGGKVLLCGNGGSAADAQHIAAELVGRFELERAPLAAVALTTDSSILTAVGNDYGFDGVFERQVRALCGPGDVVIGLSTSGSSENVARALRAAAAAGAHAVAFTGGRAGTVGGAATHVVAVPTTVTARVQEAHILLAHALCELVEATLFGDGRD